MARLAGGLLLTLVLFPWYVFVGRRATGPSAEQTLVVAPAYLIAVWGGAVFTLVGAAILGWVIPAGILESAWRRARGWLLWLPVQHLGIALGVISAVYCLAFSFL